MTFTRNIPIEAYEGSIERYEKVEAIANQITDLILKSGLSYDEAGEVLRVAQKFTGQCKITSAA